MERILVNPKDVAPTLVGDLDTNKLVAIQSAFTAKTHLELPEVELFRDRELLTMEGHHRLVSALINEVEIYAFIYDSSDPFVTVNAQRYALPPEFLDRLRRMRRFAVSVGHNSYDDLCRMSSLHLAERMSKYFDIFKETPKL